MIDKQGYNDHMVKHGGFAMVPNCLWRRKDISMATKLVWCFILSEGETWNSSRNNICRELNLGRDTVTRAIDKLKECNMLLVHESTRKAWNFEVLPPSKWSPERPDLNENRTRYESTTGLATSPLPDSHGVHNQESIINNNYVAEKVEKIPKPKKPQKPEVKVPEDLMDYYLVLKTLNLHLAFHEHLHLIQEVWPDWESFRSFLSERKEFFEQHHSINDNFHMFRATLTKAIKEMIGV